MKEKPETPDSVLVQQALAGNQEAFEALVSRYKQSLLGLIYRYLGEYHEAHDVLQQVWLQLYLSLATLRPNTHIKPWLFTVARSRSLDVLRRKRLLSFSEIETGNEEDEAASLDAIPIRAPHRKNWQSIVTCNKQYRVRSWRYLTRTARSFCSTMVSN